MAQHPRNSNKKSFLDFNNDGLVSNLEVAVFLATYQTINDISNSTTKNETHHNDIKFTKTDLIDIDIKGI